MAKAGVVDRIVITERRGQFYETYIGRYRDGGYGIMTTRKLFGTSLKSGMSGSKVAVKKAVVKEKTQTTYNKDIAYKTHFRALRFMNNPNLYTASSALGGNFGLALSLANGTSRTLRTVTNIGIDVFNSATGETTQANNARNLIGAILQPSKFIIEATYGNWLRDMEVARSNRGLEYHRGLTGQIVNTKDKGNYK